MELKPDIIIKFFLFWVDELNKSNSFIQFSKNLLRIFSFIIFLLIGLITDIVKLVTASDISANEYSLLVKISLKKLIFVLLG